MRGCCFSQVRLGSEEVEKEAPGPRVVGVTFTAAESFNFWLYCVVVGILEISAPCCLRDQTCHSPGCYLAYKVVFGLFRLSVGWVMFRETYAEFQQLQFYYWVHKLKYKMSRVNH